MQKFKKSSLYLTEIAIFEVADGIFRKRNKAEFNKFVDFISKFNIIPTESMFSLEAARIAAELRLKGIEIDDNDLLIAAMMREYGFEKIITRNKKHFGQIKGIEVIEY